VAETAWIVQGVDSALGVPLAPPHRWLRHGQWTSYWVGPQQWLITHPQREDYEAQRDKLIAAGGALFDVSDARVALRAGAEALAKGCGVDFDPVAFPPGECRSTQLARVAVLIAREESGFRLFAPRSYAQSLRRWLALDKG
jgi:heterotetrameric sarcosine oxidase gamma subunit